MKKFLAVAVIAMSLVACNEGEKKEETTTTTTDLIDEKKELFKVNYAHSFSLCEHLYTWISIGTSIIFLTVLYNSMSCAGVSREIISE